MQNEASILVGDAFVRVYVNPNKKYGNRYGHELIKKFPVKKQDRPKPIKYIGKDCHICRCFRYSQNDCTLGNAVEKDADLKYETAKIPTMDIIESTCEDFEYDKFEMKHRMPYEDEPDYNAYTDQNDW